MDATSSDIARFPRLVAIAVDALRQLQPMGRLHFLKQPEVDLPEPERAGNLRQQPDEQVRRALGIGQRTVETPVGRQPQRAHQGCQLVVRRVGKQAPGQQQRADESGSVSRMKNAWISPGIGTPGFIRLWNRSTIRLPATNTTATSVGRAPWAGESPVVSKSMTA
jgi:hypothetical protein